MPGSSMLTTLMRTTALTSGFLLCAGVACAQAGGMGSGQQPGQPQPTQQSPSQQQMQNMNGGMDNQQLDKMQGTVQDGAFVRHALEGGIAEVQLGQLALQKSSNAQVKQFAQQMIDDHTKLNASMKPVAQQLGVSVPTKVDRKDRGTIEKLSALSGSQFDQAYIKDMVSDHKGDLRDFQEEAGSAQNPAVKAVATQGVQMISAHLQMAQQMANQQTASSGQ